MNHEEKATAELMLRDAQYKARKVEMQLTLEDLRHMGRVMQAEPQDLGKVDLARLRGRDRGLVLCEAIGYLTAYAVHGEFDNAKVYRDRDDLMAFYWNDEDSRRFVMGGIWRPDLGKFTFHS